jgi:hypothetical protein
MVEVLTEARAALARPGNDYAWTRWRDGDAALVEIDEIVRRLSHDELDDVVRLTVLFAPTGPIQEVSVASGWGEEFLDIAARFDSALAT